MDTEERCFVVESCQRQQFSSVARKLLLAWARGEIKHPDIPEPINNETSVKDEKQ
jgi:hypothetical protein